eukprot:CAMPEP_0174264996 /NCGR_PEP_ID=MMETSP0439-20130205/24725_1 /TAXON_ID=0 /ORGANISM="Stereomyxa ramosa, Strain Chinc5" /LENGTH=212 /DNA_ID=CAMNT_0015351181 /DNA_START=138 /DNA_END=776 /DNA_ORIENTATION=+
MIKWIQNNSLDDGAMELYFVTQDDKETPLVENGENILVTDHNKDRFLTLMAQHKLCLSIKTQTHAFLEGFYSVIDGALMFEFDENECEMLLCGIADIDINQMKQYTLINKITEGGEKEIKWFWKAVEELSPDQKSMLLLFITASTQLPANGFQDLVPPITIRYMEGILEDDHMPCAHTCFNYLDLPKYSSEHVLKKQLLNAILYGSEGFAID